MLGKRNTDFKFFSIQKPTYFLPRKKKTALYFITAFKNK